MGLGYKILRAIVRNESMKEDPPEIYGWRVFALAAASCFGGMIFGWDTGSIGGVLAMESFQKHFHYFDKSDGDKATQSQNIVSTLQLGCFASCLVIFAITDRWGRRWSLVGTGLVTIVGVILQAASAADGQIAVMYVGRFIAGLGVGAASTLTPLYVSECAPRAIRGGLVALYQLFIVLGIMMSFWINYGCLLHVEAPARFVVPLALQAVPAVLLVFGMLMCPESPRWCARKDNWEKTTRILATLRNMPADSPYVRDEVQEMAQQLEAERILTGDASPKTLLKEMVKIPGNRKRAIISVILMICQQMTGVNAINYYAPQIFSNLGLTGTDTSLFATGVYGVVKTVSCAVFMVFVADSVGRRGALLWTSGVMFILMYIIGIYGRTQPPVEGQPVSAFGYVAIVFIYIWSACFEAGWGPCCWILVSEIPTARLRAMNVALAAAIQWLFNFMIARTVLTMQVTMGEAGYGMFFLFGSFNFLMGLFVYFFVPETKGISLEKMDALFGVTEQVKSVEHAMDEKHDDDMGHNHSERAEGTTKHE